MLTPVFITQKKAGLAGPLACGCMALTWGHPYIMACVYSRQTCTQTCSYVYKYVHMCILYIQVYT